MRVDDPDDLRADIDRLMSERQAWLDEIEELRDALEAVRHIVREALREPAKCA